MSASDPEVLAASELVSQANARLDGARAELLPQVTLNAALVSSDSTGSSADDFDDTVGFRATLPVFRGLGTVNGIQQATAEQYAAGSRFNISFATATVRLVNALAQVERDRQVVTIRERELQSLRTFLRESRQRQSSGIVSGADVNQIRVQVAEVEAELAQSNGRLQGSEARLDSLLRDASIDQFAIQDITPFLPDNEAEALQMAVAQNPVLAEAHWRAEAARRGVRVAMASLGPTADFSISGERGNDTTPGADDDMDLEFRFEVQAPLFSGGRRLADVRESQSVYRELGHRYHAARRDLIANVQSASARYNAAGRVEAVSAERLSAARNALAATREARRIGARTVSQELDARRDALNAEVAVADAQLEMVAASHDYLQQIGRVNLVYNVSN